MARNKDVGERVKPTDVLFLIESLNRRTRESPEWADRYLRAEVLLHAELSEQWLQESDQLKDGLARTRLLAMLGRPRAALARLALLMKTLAAGGLKGEQGVVAFSEPQSAGSIATLSQSV
ncbi:hypothetical protein QCE47_15945 [Caballeronia sp. LZ025]|uniref:hypothetical protein n=1 Tax=Caballeronia TaxID=1827195 RepID=UPI001FD1F0A3|nr:MULTISPECIES: hypothetical protein [Caballeronia]MDR5733826.1 hypothetical protein [Caballeronia sp. LZ025]